MGLLDPAVLEWWLPAGYLLLAALVEILWKARADQSVISGKVHDDEDAPDSMGSLRAPLLQESGGETSDGMQQPKHSITATGMLWATLTFSWGLCIYQGSRAIVEAVRHGVDTTVFISSAVLCVAWALAAVLRSRDHWRQAAAPPKMDAHGLPANRRMWWALWPFFNLAFITATVAFVNEANKGKTWSGLVNIAADDRLWNVVALAINLMFVSCSVLSGAGVTLCTFKPNAEFTAGFLSAAMFSWFSPIIDVGQTKQLDLDDLLVQVDDDLSSVVWEKMDKADPRSPLPSLSLPCGKKTKTRRGGGGGGGAGGYTRVEQEQADADAAAAEEAAAADQYRLLWRMWRVTKPLVISQGLWQLVATLTEFVPSLAMQQIIDFVSAYEKGEGGVTGRITLFVVLLFVGPLLQGVADGRNFHIGRRIGCRVRGALVGSVFRKMLKMDTASSTYSSGELTNLMSVDAQSVLEYSCYTHFIWATGLQVIVSVGLLFYVLGISAIGGVIFMVLSVPIGKWTTKKTQAFQKILMKRKDDRMSVVGETMQGIRIIKLFAWEKDFVSKIDKSRHNEMRSLRGYMMMMVGVVTQWNSVTTLVGLCTFLVHTRLLGRTLTASQGFTSLSLFGILRFPLLVLPDVVNFYLQARVSLTRIEVFLGRGNVEGQPMGADAAGDVDGNGDGHGGAKAPVGGLLVQNGTFAWPPTEHSQSGDELDDHGEGDGREEQKSHQTDALLPNNSGGSATRTTLPPLPPALPTLRGVTLEVNPGELVCVYGPTGCGKSSLLLSLLGEVRRVEGTVEINGSVAYAAQRAWIQNATLRDNVLFGSPMDPERYARVLSACALTSDLDLLEAGDQTEIGEKGINLSGGQQQRVSLARAVYAQADVYLLDDVLSAVDAHVGEHIFKHCVRGMLRDKAVIMVTHQVPMTARYADRVALMSPDGRMAEMGDPRQLMEDEGSRLWALINKVGGGERLKRQRSIDEESGSFKAEAAGSKPAMDREKNELVKEEGRQHGSPGIGIYISYIRAAGGICLFLIPYLALHLVFNGLQFGQNLLLSRWVDKLEADANDTPAMWQYIAISFAVIIAVVCRALFENLASLKASTTMHDAMTARVMRAPVGWFEKTPLGRILNRFSSDIQELDKDVMDGLGSTLVCGFSAASIVVVISYTVPFLVVALVPISVIAFVMGTRYLNASRELKRLDSVSKSPIYAHFSESVNGVSTIRAFGAQDRFVKESCRRVDACNRAHFYLWVSNRWFNVRIQLVGATVAVLAGAFIVWWGKDHIEATVAGLALLYALQFTDAVKYLVRQHALLEMQMNSVERILEYTRDVPQEAAAVVQGRRPAPTWPEAGALTVENLTVQYPNTDAPVIRGMTFEVAPRTRVGIVGRTGAGKSSLTAALFRLVEPSPGSVVTIDGVDALSLGLEDLRSRLAIVPQDPICFRGSVRSNLDPFMEYSDAAMWEALRQAHLDTSIRNGGGLDAPVDENGGNLSVGERQLMCMARALLRKSAVLVMDEATANVDPETDLLIQSTMREEFRNCTVLCIAHRLHTIIYYDRVMVLERGKLMEYASPLELLNDPNSLFYALCKKTGAIEQLKETARGEQHEKLAREGGGGGGSDEVGLSLSGGEEDAAGGVSGGGAKGTNTK